MARPKLENEVKLFRISLRLREGEDDDLIEFFEGLPKRKRAGAVKRALRQGGADQIRSDSLLEDTELDEALGNFL